MGPSVELFIATSSGDETEFIKEFSRLIKSIEPNVLSLFINTPLKDREDTPLLFKAVSGKSCAPHYLYSAAHYRIAIILLNAGADPLQANNRYEDGKRKKITHTDNSLFKAIAKGDLAMTRLLLAYIKDWDELNTVTTFHILSLASRTLRFESDFNGELASITRREREKGKTRDFKKIVEDTIIAFKAIRATKKAIKDALIEGETAKTLAKAFVEASKKIEDAKTFYLKAQEHYHELVKLYEAQIALERTLPYDPVYACYDFKRSDTPAKPEEYRPVLIAYYKDKILKANLNYFEALKGMSALEALLADIAKRSKATATAAPTMLTAAVLAEATSDDRDDAPLLEKGHPTSAATSASFLRQRLVEPASEAAIAGAGVRH